MDFSKACSLPTCSLLQIWGGKIRGCCTGSTCLTNSEVNTSTARCRASETTCRSTGYRHLQCSTSRLSGTRARVRMPGMEDNQSAAVHVQKQFRLGLWIGYRDMKRETPGSAVGNPYSRFGFLFSVLCPSLPTHIYLSWRVHFWTDLPELSVQEKKPRPPGYYFEWPRGVATRLLYRALVAYIAIFRYSDNVQQVSGLTRTKPRACGGIGIS